MGRRGAEVTKLLIQIPGDLDKTRVACGKTDRSGGCRRFSLGLIRSRWPLAASRSMNTVGNFGIHPAKKGIVSTRQNPGCAT